MKLVKYFGIFLIVVVGIIYTLLFTSFGNGIVKPILEAKINEATKLQAKLQTFHLSLSDLEVELFITPHNSVKLKGKYSPFSQSFDINYNVAFENLLELQKLTQTKLQGEFVTSGKVKGDLHLIDVDGRSDVARSKTEYHVTLKEFEPTKIVADIANLDVAKLLFMINQPHLVDAKLSLHANLHNIDPKNLDGDLHLALTDGVLDQKNFAKLYALKLPQTTFRMNLDAKLQKEILYNYKLLSNLAKLTSKGSINPKPLSLNLKYAVDADELGMFQPLLGMKIRGALKANGEVKGDKTELLATLKSNIASSNTALKVTLKNFQPSAIQANISHLQLQKILYMLYMPHYLDGNLNLQADISSLNPEHLKGNIHTTINGLLDSRYLTKTYSFKHPMPKTDFWLNAVTKLHESSVVTEAKVNSSLAKVVLSKALFDSKSQKFSSNFTASIPSLDKLYFVTDRHLRGGIEMNGDITKDEHLLVNIRSAIAGGDLKVKLHDSNLKLSLHDMRTKKVLYILKYPEIFDGGVNANVLYDLQKASGDVEATFVQGVFVKNQAFDLLYKYGKINLYKEHYDGEAKAKINKENIDATFLLRSKNSTIKSSKTYLNTEKSTIDSVITLTHRQTPITITLKGEIAKPKVGVDLKSFMKSQAGKKLEKKAEKEVKKLFKKLF